MYQLISRNLRCARRIPASIHGCQVRRELRILQCRLLLIILLFFIFLICGSGAISGGGGGRICGLSRLPEWCFIQPPRSTRVIDCCHARAWWPVAMWGI